MPISSPPIWISRRPTIDRVAALLARAAHGDPRGAQGRRDVRGDRARRDQGAVGDGDQSGGVAAAGRRGARGVAEARSVRRCRERCVATTPSTPAPHLLLPAAAWGEKDGTVTNSERRISRQRPFMPLPGRSEAGLVDRDSRWRDGSALPPPSPTAPPPMCFASTRRCRRSRTTAAAISISAASRDLERRRLRSARPGAVADARRTTRPREQRFFGDGRIFHARPQGEIRRAGAAAADASAVEDVSVPPQYRPRPRSVAHDDAHRA